MKFIIGANFNRDFKILSDEGDDLTRHFEVAKLSMEIDANRGPGITVVKIEVYADVEIDTSSLECSYVLPPTTFAPDGL